MRILKFSANWCQPCKHIKKTISELPEEYQNIFENVDTDEEEGATLADKYGIRSLPTFIVLDDSDKEISRITGTKTKDQLIEMVELYKHR